MKEVPSILRPEESNFINAIAQKYDSGISSTISVAEKEATVDKILKVTGRFCSRLLDKLPSIASEIPDRQGLFSSYIASIGVYNTLTELTYFVSLNHSEKVVGKY